MQKYLPLLLMCVAIAGCGEPKLTEYKSSQGKFKVLFPGTPKLSNQTSRFNVQVQSYHVTLSSGAFLVNYYDDDSPVPIPAEALLMEAEGLCKGLGGSLASHQATKLEGKYPGLEFSGNITKPHTGKIRGRHYLVGNRVYTIAVVGTEKTVQSTTATQFLNSFATQE